MKVYFINLDRSPARREWMESQLTEISANFERIPAVDGSSLASEEYEAAVNWEELGPKGLTRGEVGCFLSHRLAWQRIAAASERFGVVLEDDILISKNGDRFLNDDSWIPEGTAQVRLETNGVRVKLNQRRGSGIRSGIRYRFLNFKIFPALGPTFFTKRWQRGLCANLNELDIKSMKNWHGQTCFRTAGQCCREAGFTGCN